MSLFPTKLSPALGVTIVMWSLISGRVALAGLIPTPASVQAAPHPTAMPKQAVPDGGNFVFTVVNSHTAPVSTMHVVGAGSPTAIRKSNEASTIAPGETVSFAAPTGWTGRMAMYEDGYEVVDRASLLEGSFMVFPQGEAVMALDVSYVDGFTVPMVCECNESVVLGCNLDLNEVCPKDLLVNAKTCINPYRDNPIPPSSEVNIFRDCERMAYTYPTDDLATKVDIAGCSRSISCCIGTACKPHPDQTVCPARDGHAHECDH
ncbi:Osmotin, thaumatin-like protein [Hypoxylon sp. NC1633]|nr:Osmotin, thaumatin-like protein [Hypoxylon sp. NC1633]